MKIVVEKVDDFVSLLDVMKEFYSEITLYLNDKFMLVKCMDHANICLIDLKIFNLFFKSYDVKDVPDFSFKIVDFIDILKTVEKEEKLELSISEDQGYILMNVIGKLNRNYRMPLIGKQQELSDKDAEILKKELNISLKLDKDKLLYIMKALKPVGSSTDIPKVMFIIKDKQFIMRRDSGIKHGEVFFCKSEFDDTKAGYNWDYINKMVKLVNNFDSIELFYAKDLPMVLELKKLNAYILRFTLAPMVEQND